MQENIRQNCNFASFGLYFVPQSSRKAHQPDLFSKPCPLSDGNKSSVSASSLWIYSFKNFNLSVLLCAIKS